MKTGVRFTLLGLAAYAVFLVSTMPAHWAAARLPPEIRLHGVTGTPWRGRAERAEYGGHAVQGVEWRLEAPYRILRGELPWRLRIEGGAVSGFTTLALSPRSLSLRQSDLNLNLRLLERAMGRLGVRLGGRPVHLQADVLEFRREGPGEAAGTARWEQAVLRAPVAIELGTLTMEITGDAQGWLGTLANDGRRLRISGTVRLTEGWRWESEIRLAPGPEAEPALRQALPLLGNPDRSGAVTLQGRGSLGTGPAPGAD